MDERLVAEVSLIRVGTLISSVSRLVSVCELEESGRDWVGVLELVDFELELNDECHLLRLDGAGLT